MRSLTLSGSRRFGLWRRATRHERRLDPCIQRVEFREERVVPFFDCLEQRLALGRGHARRLSGM